VQLCAVGRSVLVNFSIITLVVTPLLALLAWAYIVHLYILNDGRIAALAVYSVVRKLQQYNY
jgi:hypothetical protein